MGLAARRTARAGNTAVGGRIEVVSRHSAAAAALLIVPVAAGCSGMQSALDPAGRDAARAADLFYWMTAAGIAIWAAVVALGLYAPRARSPLTERAGMGLIVGGGVAFPVLVLSVLLTFGLAEIPRMLEPAPAGGPTIEVTAQQWWWRVRYLLPDRQPIELANELRLPVGRRVNLRLASADVVHSFWVPSVAGKMDMIPGRVNRHALEPTRTGVYRGACAEFCGTSHARMNFVVAVVEPQAFDDWIAGQAQPARTPEPGDAERGRAAFAVHGCANCHAIRGTDARGVVGPDLTHLASRHTIAAGTLPLDEAALRRWITQTQLVKPGAHMPAFAQLPDDVVAAMAAYLTGLE